MRERLNGKLVRVPGSGSNRFQLPVDTNPACPIRSCPPEAHKTRGSSFPH